MLTVTYETRKLVDLNAVLGFDAGEPESETPVPPPYESFVLEFAGTTVAAGQMETPEPGGLGCARHGVGQGLDRKGSSDGIPSEEFTVGAVVLAPGVLPPGALAPTGRPRTWLRSVGRVVAVALLGVVTGLGALAVEHHLRGARQAPAASVLTRE